ncbi:hypothetical protein RRG08_008510 [Elysia crispata]|uniref:Uncharacterized protein n=1 Tax=Elysia crispata TaxID=231223 RepID=A0AAE0Z877_9GAST|nr:hypothetical protein RRG08_008510 [Elysia crispata]
MQSGSTITEASLWTHVFTHRNKRFYTPKHRPKHTRGPSKHIQHFGGKTSQNADLQFWHLTFRPQTCPFTSKYAWQKRIDIEGWREKWTKIRVVWGRRRSLTGCDGVTIIPESNPTCLGPPSELFLKASRVELEIDTSQFEFQSRLEAVGYMEVTPHLSPYHSYPTLMSLSQLPHTYLPSTVTPHLCPYHSYPTLISLAQLPHTYLPITGGAVSRGPDSVQATGLAYSAMWEDMRVDWCGRASRHGEQLTRLITVIVDYTQNTLPVSRELVDTITEYELLGSSQFNHTAGYTRIFLGVSCAENFSRKFVRGGHSRIVLPKISDTRLPLLMEGLFSRTSQTPASLSSWKDCSPEHLRHPPPSPHGRIVLPNISDTRLTLLMEGLFSRTSQTPASLSSWKDCSPEHLRHPPPSPHGRIVLPNISDTRLPLLMEGLFSRTSQTPASLSSWKDCSPEHLRHPPPSPHGRIVLPKISDTRLPLLTP